MKKRQLIGILTLCTILFASVGFVTVQKNNKLAKDIQILCSKNWNPIRQTGTVNTECKINYYADHTYKLVLTAKPGVVIKGDTMMLGKWSIDSDRKIHIVAYEKEKVVDLLKIDNNTLVLKDNSDNKIIEYLANSQSVPYVIPNPNANLNKINLERAPGLTNKKAFQE